MNCRRIQELIPLFVEDDLDSLQKQLVSDHLKSCEICRLLVDDFRESQGWLKSYVPREFDGSYFESIGRQVRAGIGEGVKPSSRDRIIGRFWRLQLPIAVGALLVLVTLITFFFLRSRPEHGLSNDMAVEQEKADKSPGVPGRSTATGGPPAGPGVMADLPRPGRTRRPSEKASPRAQQEAEIALQSDASNPHSFDFEETQEPAGDSKEPFQLTIYIQTNDPNIRIIWLVPKPLVLKQLVLKQDDGE